MVGNIISRKGYITCSMLILVSIILLSGCSNNSASGSKLSDNLSTIESKVVTLEQKLNQQQEQLENQEKLIQEKQQELRGYKKLVSKYERQTSGMEINLHILSDLINSTTISRTAILEEIISKDDNVKLKVKYAEVQRDENNQYAGLAVSEEIKIINISKELPIYLKDWSNDGVPKQMIWEDVNTALIKGLFLELYERDEEVVFIIERYIP